jgi:hypothetical protein
MSQIKAIVPTPLADVPTLDHKDMVDNSNPAPSANMMSEIAAATKAPPITAAQDMPDEDTSRWEGTDNSEFAMSAPISAGSIPESSSAGAPLMEITYQFSVVAPGQKPSASSLEQ